jgi:hypothetical protein
MTDPFSKLIELSSHFPERIAMIFAFDRKKDLEKHLKDLVITREDLARANFSASLAGYQHQLKNFEYIPQPIKEKVPEIGRLLGTGDTKRAVGILNGVFGQRRLSFAHIFEKKEEWHIFYFDHRDILESEDNHWKYGAHIHFVNHLWANLKKEDVWDSLAGRSNKAYGLHVRFKRYSNGG